MCEKRGSDEGKRVVGQAYIYREEAGARFNLGHTHTQTVKKITDRTMDPTIITIHSGDNAKQRVSHIVDCLKKQDSIMLQSKNSHSFQKMISIVELLKQQSGDRKLHQYNKICDDTKTEFELRIWLSNKELNNMDGWSYQS